MKKHYDCVFLTNTPSFYKINLCNQIALTHSVLLVLYGYGSEAVNVHLDHSRNFRFDYVFLHKGNASKRNKITTFFKLCCLMRQLHYKKVFYSGWFIPEYNLMSFFTPVEKNCIICESSIIESHFSGLKGWIKKSIINRMGTALPSGEPHRKIFDLIGYKGKIVLTGGVGIFNKQMRQLSLRPSQQEQRYLYVGRLIDCKNLHLLINTFNRLGKQLTIVGAGEQENELKAMSKENITFLGFIENDKLKEIYQTHDVFILPSKSEAWGLVVEEAIYWGLPVIVSDRVGSHHDMVKKLKTGCVFHFDDTEDLEAAIKEMEKHYDVYRQNVLDVDFNRRDLLQVNAYTQLCEDN